MSNKHTEVEDIVNEHMKEFDNECQHFPNDFVRSVFTKAITKAKEEEKPRKGTALEIITNWVKKFPSETNLRVQYSDTAMIITITKEDHLPDKK